MEMQVREAGAPCTRTDPISTTTVYLIERKIFLAPRFFLHSTPLASQPNSHVANLFSARLHFRADDFEAESGKNVAHLKAPQNLLWEAIFGQVRFSFSRSGKN